MRHDECKTCALRVDDFDPNANKHVQQVCFDKFTDDEQVKAYHHLFLQEPCRFACPYRVPVDRLYEKCRTCKHIDAVYIKDNENYFKNNINKVLVIHGCGRACSRANIPPFPLYKPRDDINEFADEFPFKFDCVGCKHATNMKKHNTIQWGNVMCCIGGCYCQFTTKAARDDFIGKRGKGTSCYKPMVPNEKRECDQYTPPESPAPEKHKHVELKCDTCAHYPIQVDPKRVILCGKECGSNHEAYIPRECENCKHDRGTCYSKVGLCKSHDKWEPRAETRSCESCGFKHDSPTKTSPERYLCQAAGGLGDLEGCKRAGTWRSWIPIKEKEKNEVIEMNETKQEKKLNTADCEDCINYPGNGAKRCNDGFWIINVLSWGRDNCSHYKKKETYTCPACGATDDVLVNYCSNCGISTRDIIPRRRVNVLEDIEEELQTNQRATATAKIDWEIPERKEKKEKTRKIIRIKDRFNLGIGMLNFALGTIIYAFVGPLSCLGNYALGVWYTCRGFSFVDVPRVPAIVKFRAWRQARKNKKRYSTALKLKTANEEIMVLKKQVTMLNEGIKELDAELVTTRANHDINLIRINKEHEKEDKEKEILMDELEYAKSMARIHENNLELAKQVIEKKKTKIAEIIKDRDANYISMANRIPVQTKQLRDIETNLYSNKTILAIEEEKDGIIAQLAIKGKLGDLLFFLRNAVPEKKHETTA